MRARATSTWTRTGTSRGCRSTSSLPLPIPAFRFVHPRIFAKPPSGNFSTNRMWDIAIRARRLFGIRLDGVWIHVGTPEAVAEAEAFLADLPLVR